MNTQTHCRDLAYILAPSYTGSTLLTFLLAKHKDIATIGELKATARGDLSAYSCSCGALQRECSFWKEVTAQMQKLGTSFTLEDFGTHFRSTSPLSDRLLRASVRGGLFELVRNTILGLLPGSRRCLQGILERNQQLIEIVCKLQGGRVFLDGSKDPIRLRHLHLADRWNIKVLYLIRDGRGAANSYMRHYHVPMATAAREWRLTHRECDRVIGELSDDTYIRVHYEDLCAKPRATLGSIYAFLGLEPDLDDVRLSVLQQHILGNEMRLRSVEEIKLDEKWKSVLAPEDIRVFERVAGRYNHALRYG